MRAKAEQEENQVRHHKVRGPPTVSAPRQCQESVNGSASELAESFRLGTFLILSFRQCHSTSVQHHLRVWTGPVTCECSVRSVTISCKDAAGSGHHQALLQLLVVAHAQNWSHEQSCTRSARPVLSVISKIANILLS